MSGRPRGAVTSAMNRTSLKMMYTPALTVERSIVPVRGNEKRANAYLFAKTSRLRCCRSVSDPPASLMFQAMRRLCSVRSAVISSGKNHTASRTTEPAAQSDVEIDTG